MCIEKRGARVCTFIFQIKKLHILEFILNFSTNKTKKTTFKSKVNFMNFVFKFPSRRTSCSCTRRSRTWSLRRRGPIAWCRRTGPRWSRATPRSRRPFRSRVSRSRELSATSLASKSSPPGPLDTRWPLSTPLTLHRTFFLNEIK